MTLKLLKINDSVFDTTAGTVRKFINNFSIEPPIINRDQYQFIGMTLLQKRPSKSRNMIRLKKTTLSQEKELLLF